MQYCAAQAPVHYYPPPTRTNQHPQPPQQAHPFFLPIDWAALYRREVAPPQRLPLPDRRVEDVRNFSREFTALKAWVRACVRRLVLLS